VLIRFKNEDYGTELGFTYDKSETKLSVFRYFGKPTLLGIKEKYFKKYQKVIKRLEEGSSIREIAAIYSISPTTVQKVKSTYMA
jgi:DNA-binding NarL/FixJ family response regulator